MQHALLLSFSYIRPALPAIRELLLMHDEEVVLYACQILSCITQMVQVKWSKPSLKQMFRVTTVSPWLVKIPFVSFLGKLILKGDFIHVFFFSCALTQVSNVKSYYACSADSRRYCFWWWCSDSGKKMKISKYLLILGTSSYIVIKVVKYVTTVSN
jgi:hypothetical protein